MAGVYGHVMLEWWDRLRTQLQELWEASLHERARLSHTQLHQHTRPLPATSLFDRRQAPRQPKSRELTRSVAQEPELLSPT
jgi:hypothetical protein